jgi:hypothetical protein
MSDSPTDCPRPEKAAHTSLANATRAARARAKHYVADHRFVYPFYAYRCSCSSWHLTRRPSWDGRANVLVLEIATHLQEFAGTTIPEDAR